MITTGGSDPFNLTLRLANAILPEEEFKDVRINIVVAAVLPMRTSLESCPKETRMLYA